MASLDEDVSSPIDEMIERVKHTVMPVKEELNINELLHIIQPQKEYDKRGRKARRKAKVAARGKKTDARPPPPRRPRDPKTGGNPRTGKSGDDKKNRKDDLENDKKGYLDKIGGAAGLAGLAALGITAAVASAMAIQAAIDVTACEDAVISITNIGPSNNIPDWVPEWQWLRKLFPLPSTVDITYNVTTSYTPIAMKDTWDITGTGTELDGGSPKKILSIPGSKTVRIKCVSAKCSNVVSTKGTVDINCGDFADRMNEKISEAATDIASTVGRTMKSFGEALTGNLPLIIFICVIAAVLFFVVPIFFK